MLSLLILVITISATLAQPVSTGDKPNPANLVFKGLPLDRDVGFYLKKCRQDPANRVACDPLFRKVTIDDEWSLVRAAKLGVTLKRPVVVNEAKGDYDVGDPFDVAPSGLLKQLSVVLSDMQKQADATAAAAAAAAAAAQAKIEAEAAAAAKAAADKVAAEKAAADAAEAARLKAEAAGADAAAQKAAADAAAAKALQDEIARQAAAKALADKAAADAAAKAAADKAAADAAAEAARPKIKRVGGRLISPTGKTLYFMAGESPSSTICVGGCLPFWPRADPTWGADPSAGCAVSSFVRADGERQLACGSRPLYMFRDDSTTSSNGSQMNPDFQPA